MRTTHSYLVSLKSILVKRMVYSHY